jgi:hypothetical protein
MSRIIQNKADSVSTWCYASFILPDSAVNVLLLGAACLCHRDLIDWCHHLDELLSLRVVAVLRLHRYVVGCKQVSVSIVNVAECLNRSKFNLKKTLFLVSATKMTLPCLFLVSATKMTLPCQTFKGMKSQISNTISQNRFLKIHTLHGIIVACYNVSLLSCYTIEYHSLYLTRYNMV